MKIKYFVLILLAASFCVAQTPDPVTPETPWQMTISPQNEPGDALQVSGTVYGPDGKTPIAGATVYVYHTDIRGYYSQDTRSGSTNPRIKGTMRTNAEGNYAFRSIKPGPYPDSRVPAHIHYIVSAPGYKQKVFEIVFDDDPFVTANIRARARQENTIYSIKKLERDPQGAWRCVQDVQLQRE